MQSPRFELNFVPQLEQLDPLGPAPASLRLGAHRLHAVLVHLPAVLLEALHHPRIQRLLVL